MSLSALVIGFGSIGKRHAEIMNAMDEVAHLSVLSSQSGLPYNTLSSLEEIPRLNPDYVVIASPTDQHDPQLKFLEEHLQGKKILVEKPLFDSMAEFKVRNNEVVVGYNLRFHPLLNKIRELCQGRRLWNIHVFCGSYLPDWRPGRDYRATSSARKHSGGGVLLDISHELDYVQWLCGKIIPEYVCNEKVSDLDIDTDDLLILSGRTEGGAHLQIGLNYFTRKPIRKIIIDGKDISIHADLITNTATIHENGISSDYSWPNFIKNDMYITQHKDILSDKTSWTCTYEEGKETMGLIDIIRSLNNR